MAVFDTAGPDTLERVTPNGVETWPLPDTDYNGYIGQVKIAPDGGVWVTEPYALVRFDPTAHAASVLPFDRDVTGAFPDAWNPDSPVIGTWISSVCFSSDGWMLVARTNVPFVSIVSAAGPTLGSIPVPAEYAGALDLAEAPDGSVYVAGGYATSDAPVARVSKTGAVVGTLAGPASRFSPGSDGLLISGSGSTGVWVDPSNGDEAALASGLSTNPDSLAVPDPRGGAIAYDASTGTISRLVNGEIVDLITMGKTRGFVTTPLGGSVAVTGSARVTDLATASDGTTYFLDGNSQRLLAVKL